MRSWLATGAVLIAGLAAGGCLGGDQRDEVESYLERANAIQGEAEGVNRAVSIYRRIAEGDVRLSLARPRLEQAEATIAAIRASLEQLEPPGLARDLHDQLVEVFRLNHELAAETGKLATFLPAARVAIEPLAATNRRMTRGLESPAAAVQASALRRYGREIGVVIAALRKLEPPIVLAAAHRGRIRQLGSVRSLAGRLREALLREDGATVGKLLVRFSRAAQKQPPAGLDPGSVKRYERRYRALVRATRQLRREESELRRRTLDL